MNDSDQPIGVTIVPLEQVAALKENKWRFARRFALGNCAIFLFMSALIYVAEAKSIVVILSAPAVFFIGCLLAFALMVQSGVVLAPLAWFVLGAGIYFGLGSLAGGLRVHPYSEQIFGNDILYLTRVNLLNSCSVLIVVGIALLLIQARKSVWQANGGSLVDRYYLLKKVYPYVLLLAATCVSMKFVFFPIADNLILRSVIGKLNLFTPACFLLLGMLWKQLAWPLKMVTIIICVLEGLNGVLAVSKYQIIYVMLALIIGMWIIRPGLKLILLSMSGLVLVFYLINPLITLARAHNAYDPFINTLADRIDILHDTLKSQLDSDVELLTVGAGQVTWRVDLEKMNKPEERLRAMGRRFEVASIQGYLINEYNSGRPGDTLSYFWVTFIPRIFWPQKPIINQPGSELHKQYFNDPSQVSSSMAPTYSAEAYWNYGPLGVVLASVLLGLAIGWLTHYSFLAIYGVRPEYFLIAFSAAIWACFVESWLVSSYLGEFVIFVVILVVARILMKCNDYLKKRKHVSLSK